jgi:hypothetical protein
VADVASVRLCLGAGRARVLLGFHWRDVRPRPTRAFGNRPDRSGDFFLYLCVSGLIAIISARIVAWLARPNKADGMSLFSGSTGRLARFATIAVVIVGVWIVAIVVATKF